MLRRLAFALLAAAGLAALVYGVVLGQLADINHFATEI